MSHTKNHESAEDYLETILILQNSKGSVRAVDIAAEMGFSRPSVSIAMKNFRQSGYITVDTEGHITLTEEGLRIAKSTYQRHMLLTRLLISMGVDEKTAREDACGIEHHISEETFARLSALAERFINESENK